MRIGDKVTCSSGPGWAIGKEVEIKGIIRDYRTIRDSATLEAKGLGRFHNARLNVDSGESDMIR